MDCFFASLWVFVSKAGNFMSSLLHCAPYSRGVARHSTFCQADMHQ